MPTDSPAVDPKAEITEYKGPVSTYQIVESKPPESNNRFVAAAMDQPAVPEAAAASPAAGEPVTSEAIVAPEPDEEAVAEHGNRNKLYAALGAGLGLLAALAFVASFLLPGKSDGSYDMGPVTARAYGLKASLVTKWGDQLNYKLTVEPAGPEQAAGFVNAVYSSPKPLSVTVQLKDPLGNVLCGNTILVRFDPLKNTPAVTPVAEAANGKRNQKIDESSLNRAEMERALNNARLEGQELGREHGKDVFENVAGPGGQVASLSAQGVLPCTKKQYENTASWGMTSNFPVIAGQADAQGAPQNADSSATAPSPDNGAELRSPPLLKKRKPAAPVSHFSIEEDDAVVGYQSAAGTIETRAGKTFRVEKKDTLTSALKGVDLPVPIHYRCDQFGTCTLAGVGAGAQRAWMER